MYYSHFGLNQPPFKITPNTDFFFSGGNRGPVLEALIYAISQGEGIVKVTGEVGSGKTMLCHMLQARLPEHIENVYIANPSVSPEEILRAIAFELQLGVARDASRLEVMQALHEYLLKRHSENKRIVVFVEESQSMPLPTLEEIRLLSNLETKSDKLLQIVLFGQPELDENLRQTNIRQLRERITHSFRLAPLSPAETREYLMFRMRAAGYHGPDLFPDPVVKAISRAAQGLTRRVNLIADKALLAAFSENTHTVKRKHVDAAVRDSEFSALPGTGFEFRPAWGVALLAAGAAAGIAIYVLLQESVKVDERVVVEKRESVAAVPKSNDAHKELIAAESKTEPRNPPPKRETTQVAKPPSSPPQVPAAKAPASAPAPASSPGPSPSERKAAGPVAAASEPAKKPKPEPPLVAPPPTRVASAPQPTPKAAAAATSTQISESKDIMDQRIQATEAWLAGASPKTLSIQLMGTNEPEFLKSSLNELSKLIEMNEIFVYRTQANKKPFLTVLYGRFNSYRAAQEALDKLPESLKVNRPFLRTVAGIREEIARLAAS